MTHLGVTEGLFLPEVPVFILYGKHDPKQETQHYFSDANKYWDLVQVNRLVRFSVSLFSKSFWENEPSVLDFQQPSWPLPSPVMLQPTVGTAWPSHQFRFTCKSGDHSSLQEGSPRLVVPVTQRQFKLIVPSLNDWLFAFFLDLVPEVFPLSLTQEPWGYMRDRLVCSCSLMT